MNSSVNDPALASLGDLSKSLYVNLSSGSHVTRSSTLRTLQRLTELTKTSSPDLIQSMLDIETTARTVENIRSTSLAMRKLPILSSVEHDEILINFCFGLLTINFAPLWSDACSVLRVLAERSGAKVWELVFAPLNRDSDNECTTTQIPTHEKSNSSSVQSFADNLWDAAQQDSNISLQLLYDKVN